MKCRSMYIGCVKSKYVKVIYTNWSTYRDIEGGYICGEEIIVREWIERDYI